MRLIVALLAILALTTPAVASDLPAVIPLIASWGGPGSGPGQFNFPSGIAVAANGNVYVVDRNNHRVQYFTPSGGYLGEWGVYGDGPGQFLSPHGIAIDKSDNVYVTDVLSSRVQKFTRAGEYLATFAGEHIYRPGGIAVDSRGDVYVGNSYPLRQVSKFDSSGQFLMAFGPSEGWGVDVDSHGCVLVTTFPLLLQRFTADGTLAAFWTPGVGFPEDALLGLAVDDLDNVLVIRRVADISFVDVFSHGLTRIDTWLPRPPAGGGTPELGQIALGEGGVAYLTDSRNSAILKLGYSAPVPTVIATWSRLKSMYR
jgi:DNA-binding beta-propeller fold protein YncE